jgi:hypothetical protein
VGLGPVKPCFELVLNFFSRFQAYFSAPDQWIYALAATILIVNNFLRRALSAPEIGNQPEAQRKIA